jgi:hypothetical protein
MEIVGGLWNNTQRREYRYIARYSEQAYVLEKWCEPRLYGTPELWDELNRDSWGYLSCGAFPHKGEYETSHIFCLDGIYQQPVPALLRAIALNVERGTLFSLSDKRIAIRDRLAEEKRVHHQFISDDFEEQMPERYGVSFGYGGKTNTADIEKVRMDRKVSDLPAAIQNIGPNSISQL